MIRELLSRAVAWLRRNPEARADALELAAAASRSRAAQAAEQGRLSVVRRSLARAQVFELRAQQLRSKAR